MVSPTSHLSQEEGQRGSKEMSICHGWVSHLCRSNVLPLGSYDVLIGMDWLEAHRAKLDCYNKTFECLDEEGKLKVVKGIPKVILERKDSTMQLKNLCGKGCRVYAAHVWRWQRMILLGWRAVMWYRNS